LAKPAANVKNPAYGTTRWRYLVSFARQRPIELEAILVENREIFIPHLCPRRNFAQVFDTHKTTMIGEEIVTMLSRFDTIAERGRQTDGQTNRQNSYINIAPRHADAR